MSQEWWAPEPTTPRPAVALPVPLDALPDVVDRAVHTVPGAVAMEIRADGAVIGRRTSFALRAENIVLAFRSDGPGRSRVEILREGRDGLSYGQVLFVTPMARAILAAVRNAAAAPAPAPGTAADAAAPGAAADAAAPGAAPD